MTHPDPHSSPRPDRTADVTQPRSNTGGAAGDAAPDRPADIYVHSEAALGGADAIQKTSWVVGQGTEPSARNEGDATAHPRAGGGPNYVAWGIGAIAAAVALVYLFGLLT